MSGRIWATKHMRERMHFSEGRGKKLNWKDHIHRHGWACPYTPNEPPSECSKTTDFIEGVGVCSDFGYIQFNCLF